MRRAASLSLLVGLLIPASGAFAAGPVEPANCIVPKVLLLTGQTASTSGTVWDDTWQYVVRIRDAASDPIQGARVRIDFGACEQSFPSSDQHFTIGGNPCDPDSKVEMLTDANGFARFTIVGSTLHRQGVDQNPDGCALVTVEDPLNPGVEIILAPQGLTRARVASFDLDGANGVRASDMWLWICERFAGNSHLQRADYNGDNQLNPVDLSLWLTAYYRERSDLTAARCDLASAQNGISVVNGTLGLKASACGVAGGTSNFALTCLADDPDLRIVGTVVLPAALNLSAGFEATLDLLGPGAGMSPFPGTPLPDFLRFDGAGCNSGFMATNNETLHPAFGCTFPWGNFQSAPVVFDWPYPDGLNAGREDMARLRIVGAPGANSNGPAPMAANIQYMAFFLTLVQDPNMTAGCAGCNTPAAMVFKSLRVTPPGSGTNNCALPALQTNGILSIEPDVIVYASSSDTENVMFLNGVPDGFQTTGVTPVMPSGSRIAACAPSPARELVRVQFVLAREGRSSLVVYDLAGRQVRELTRGHLAAGEHSSTWDLRRDDGTRAPNGTYFVRLRDATGVQSRTLIALD